MALGYLLCALPEPPDSSSAICQVMRQKEDVWDKHEKLCIRFYVYLIYECASDIQAEYRGLNLIKRSGMETITSQF